MKRILFVLIFLFAYGCNKPKTVYICGDHVCINKAEAKQYFEDNLTLEVKVIDEKKGGGINLVELNLGSSSEGEKEVSVIKKNQTKKTVKILSNALDANMKGLEPLDSLSSILDPVSGGFFDYNYNNIRDTAFVNLIYDTSLGFRIWKGSYPRDENSVPYRINPWQWNIEEAPSGMMWLYFDYYGLQMVTYQSTSESYFNYFSGDPVGQNIYLLPKSNFESGLGIFYSSFSSSFLVYVKRDD